MALISTASTLESRIPFLHFFDGFRTSHEVNKIEQLTNDDLKAMMDEKLITAHRERGLNPNKWDRRVRLWQPLSARSPPTSCLVSVRGTC